MELGERIKMARKASRWTQVELAQRARVSQQLIAKLESGEVKETRKLPQIAEAFGMSVDALISLTDKFDDLEEKFKEDHLKTLAPPPVPPASTTADLDPIEATIIQAYRIASREDQEAILGAAAAVYRHLKAAHQQHEQQVDRIKNKKPFWDR